MLQVSFKIRNGQGKAMREIRRLWKASAKLKSNSFLVLDIELVFRKQIAVYMNSQRFFADHALCIDSCQRNPGPCNLVEFMWSCNSVVVNNGHQSTSARDSIFLCLYLGNCSCKRNLFDLDSKEHFVEWKEDEDTDEISEDEKDEICSGVE